MRSFFFVLCMVLGTSLCSLPSAYAFSVSLQEQASSGTESVSKKPQKGTNKKTTAKKKSNDKAVANKKADKTTANKKEKVDKSKTDKTTADKKTKEEKVLADKKSKINKATTDKKAKADKAKADKKLKAEKAKEKARAKKKKAAEKKAKLMAEKKAKKAKAKEKALAAKKAKEDKKRAKEQADKLAKEEQKKVKADADKKIKEEQKRVRAEAVKKSKAIKRKQKENRLAADNKGKGKRKNRPPAGVLSAERLAKARDRQKYSTAAHPKDTALTIRTKSGQSELDSIKARQQRLAAARAKDSNLAFLKNFLMRDIEDPIDTIVKSTLSDSFSVYTLDSIRRVDSIRLLTLLPEQALLQELEQQETDSTVVQTENQIAETPSLVEEDTTSETTPIKPTVITVVKKDEQEIPKRPAPAKTARQHSDVAKSPTKKKEPATSMHHKPLVAKAKDKAKDKDKNKNEDKRKDNAKEKEIKKEPKTREEILASINARKRLAQEKYKAIIRANSTRYYDDGSTLITLGGFTALAELSRYLHANPATRVIVQMMTVKDYKKVLNKENLTERMDIMKTAILTSAEDMLIPDRVIISSKNNPNIPFNKGGVSVRFSLRYDYE